MLPTRNLAHVWIPDLPIQVERPRVGPGPLVIASAIEVGTLLACSPDVATLGLGPGSSRYVAEQMLPEAVVLEADEHAYHAVHAAAQAALQTFTPEVETIGLGEWAVDLRGVTAGVSAERRERGVRSEGRKAKSAGRGERGARGAEAGVKSEAPTFAQVALFEQLAAVQPRLLVEAGAQANEDEGRRTTPRARAQAPTSAEAMAQRLTAIAQALAAAVQTASGLQVQIGVAGNRFTAEQAAKSAERSGKRDFATLHAPHSSLLPLRIPITIVPSGEEARFLAPLSVEVLPHLPGEARRRLHLLDLHTLGDLAALRKPAVLRQFGGDFAGLHDLACGRDPRPVRADAPPLRIVRSLLLPELDERGLILNALGRLARQVGRALQHSGHHAEALRLTLTLDDGRRLEIGAAVKPPSSDETRLMRLAAQLLGRLDVPAPVVSAAVSAYPLRSWHLGFYQRALREADALSEAQGRLETALHGLARRFGEAAVRVAALFGPPLPLPIDVDLSANGQPLRFRLGGRGYAVIAVDETWREERRWWDRPIRRDYFRLQVGDGSPRTIYQDLDRASWHLDRAWPR